MESPVRKKILIVEDEQAIANAMRVKLEEAGYATVIVTNGQAALDTLAREPYDLVLLDIIMPNVNGFRVLADLKKDQHAPPVVVLSNLGQEEDMKRAKLLGAIAYFVKADTPLADVVAFVDKTLSSRNV